VLAYHYTSALELAQAAGQADQAAELEAPALRFLVLAGERALGLDTAAALVSFERALALTPQGNPDRAGTLARFGEAAFHAGRYGEAKDALEEAVATFEAAGDARGAAGAMGALALVLHTLADPHGWELPTQAVALLDPLEPGPELVSALTELARAETLRERNETAVAHAERALILAEQLDLPRPARSLGYRGLARSKLGDRGALDDFRQAIALATQAGQGREVALLHNNFSIARWAHEGSAAALETTRTGLAFAQARGLTDMADSLTANAVELLVETGEHEQALALAAELAIRYEASGNMLDLAALRAGQTEILSLRGQETETAGWLEFMETTAREAGQAELTYLALTTTASARAALGQRTQAADLLRELEATPAARGSANYAANLPTMVRTALTLGDPVLAERLVAEVGPDSPYQEHAVAAVKAALAEADGDLETAVGRYSDAASRWQAFGVVPEQGFALLGQGRCLTALGRTSEAASTLQRAREIFQTLQAAPALAEIDQLLEEATALSG